MKKPAWFRTQLSCPDCGIIIRTKYEKDSNHPQDFVVMRKDGKFLEVNVSLGEAWDCPACHAHYTADDFWEEHHDKMYHVASYYDPNTVHLKTARTERRK